MRFLERACRFHRAHRASPLARPATMNCSLSRSSIDEARESARMSAGIANDDSRANAAGRSERSVLSQPYSEWRVAGERGNPPERTPMKKKKAQDKQ